MYSPREYLQAAKELYVHRGPKGLFYGMASYGMETGLRLARPVLDKQSTYVLEKDWDVLLILDACRVDVLESVADEYDFLPEPPHNTIWSAASSSRGWMTANFKEEKGLQYSRELQNTAMITGNPFSEQVFDGDEFEELDEVWRYAWDDGRGLMPPRPLTDSAISYYQNHSPNRMIVHYMQPHAPFISDKFEDNFQMETENFGGLEGSLETRTPWELLRDGVISRETIWNAYQDTLRVVLDDVELLLSQIEAENVVISADHGNAMGEWGIYDHPEDMPVPSIRTVPWIETTATNSGNYTPTDWSQSQDTEEGTDVESQLEALGYK